MAHRCLLQLMRSDAHTRPLPGCLPCTTRLSTGLCLSSLDSSLRRFQTQDCCSPSWQPHWHQAPAWGNAQKHLQARHPNQCPCTTCIELDELIVSFAQRRQPCKRSGSSLYCISGVKQAQVLQAGHLARCSAPSLNQAVQVQPGQRCQGRELANPVGSMLMSFRARSARSAAMAPVISVISGMSFARAKSKSSSVVNLSPADLE
jgi:hypothetical protein